MAAAHEPRDELNVAASSGLWVERRFSEERELLDRDRCLRLARTVLASGPAAAGASGDRSLSGSLAAPDDVALAAALRDREAGDAVLGGEPRSVEAQVLCLALATAEHQRQLEGRFDEAVAEARLEAVRELAYGAGHEINNPLANIAARAQSLLPGEQDIERRRRLAAIVDQAFRARDMIGGLMVFARPPRPQPADVSVESVVRPALEWMRPQALARGIRLEYAPAPCPLAVRVDATQVGEVLRMLAVNAFEAVEPGGSVRVEVAGQPGDSMCRLVIADDGRGMDADVARRACDPFFSGREAGRGIGLGLPKAWRLLEASGGAIAVESRPLAGTTVTVTLPMAGAGGSQGELASGGVPA